MQLHVLGNTVQIQMRLHNHFVKCGAHVMLL